MYDFYPHPDAISERGSMEEMARLARGVNSTADAPKDTTASVMAEAETRVFGPSWEEARGQSWSREQEVLEQSAHRPLSGDAARLVMQTSQAEVTPTRRQVHNPATNAVHQSFNK